MRLIFPKVKSSTYNRYKNILQWYLNPYLRLEPMSNISNEKIEVLCNFLLSDGGIKKSGLSSKTVSDTLSVLRSIIKYSNRIGISNCNVDYAVKIKHSTKQLRILSHYEQEILCQYLLEHLDSFNLGILLSLFTGLRIGEVCALRWEDISLEEKVIHVHQTVQRIQNTVGSETKTRVVITAPKSSCSIRIIPIPNELVNIIAKERLSASGFLLSNHSKPVEPRTMENHFKKAIQSCFIKNANYHCLRHTFATRCIELGFDIKSLSEILGHSTVNITMNCYVHPSMKLKKDNMEKLSSLLTVK